MEKEEGGGGEREEGRRRREKEEEEGGEGGRRSIGEPPYSQKIRQIGYSTSRLIKKSVTCPRSSKAVFMNTI